MKIAKSTFHPGRMNRLRFAFANPPKSASFMKSLCSVLAVSAAVVLTQSALAQGSLTPPGAPAPNFKTLQQVEPRTPIDSVNTPGDANSIYKITTAGSYYLVGNVSMGGRLPIAQVGGITPIILKQTGIEVTANNVTIDLNGFRISGGGTNYSLSGITIASGLKNVTVRNGTITDCGLDGIRASGVNNSRFEDLTLENNEGNGLVTGDQCDIRSCQATGNSQMGIVVSAFATISDCQVRSNPKGGIKATSRAVISRCTSGDASSGDGIIAESFCVVDRCTVYNAYGFGIRTLQRPVITDCVVDSCGHPDVNGVSGGILLHYAGLVKHCTISFNLVGIEILGTSDGGGASVLENEIDSNTGGGIDILSGANRIEGNMISFNGGPAIRSHERGNLIFRNVAAGNGGVDYTFGAADTYGPVVSGVGSTTGLAGGTSPWANFQR